MMWCRPSQTGIWHLIDKMPSFTAEAIRPLCTSAHLMLAPDYVTQDRTPEVAWACPKWMTIVARQALNLPARRVPGANGRSDR